MADPREVAIISIHGSSLTYRGRYAARHSWPHLQIAELRRHTPPGYTVVACGNALMAEHRAFLQSCPEVEYVEGSELDGRVLKNVWPLRNQLVRRVQDRFRYVVMLDSDAFPVGPGWLDRYVAALTSDCPMAAVQRLENGDVHSDRSFMVFASETARRYEFDFAPGRYDAGGRISDGLEERGLAWRALTRTNAWNPHPLIAGIYDDLIYHHAAGSRRPLFRMNREAWRADAEAEERRQEMAMHCALMHELHAEPALFIDRLAGRAPPIDERSLLLKGHAVMAEFRAALQL
jgi:hypothetical protein